MSQKLCCCLPLYTLYQANGMWRSNQHHSFTHETNIDGAPTSCPTCRLCTKNNNSEQNKQKFVLWWLHSSGGGMWWKVVTKTDAKQKKCYEISSERTMHKILPSQLFCISSMWVTNMNDTSKYNKEDRLST